MFKRFISIVVAAIMFVMIIPSTLAFSTEEITEPSIDDILDEYCRQALNAQTNSDINTCSDEQATDIIKQETITRLWAAGHEAYDVNPDTFSDVESKLKTNFAELGLDPSSSYIVVVSGDNGETGDTYTGPSSRKIEGGAFEYTYNGITHTMRFLTVLPTDNMHYQTQNSIELIKDSTTARIIQNCLNSAVFAVVDNLGTVSFGTIASLAGIEPIKINTIRRTSATLSGGAYWTRVYTQIYDSGLKAWFSWASVARVQTLAFVTGQYYDSAEQLPKEYIKDEQRGTIYSEHYNDYDWRKSQAAAGWTYSFPRSEFTGDVKIYYGNKIVFNFYEWTGLI